jgi:hypothetical protein
MEVINVHCELSSQCDHVEHPSKKTLGLLRLTELPKLRQFLPSLESKHAITLLGHRL